MTIDFTKPVQTKNELPVVIITTDGRGQYPVVGYIGLSKYVSQWRLNGQSKGCALHDLENVPERYTGYFNIFSHFDAEESVNASFYRTEEAADIARVWLDADPNSVFLTQLKITHNGSRMISCEVL